ncbi:MAG TPA: helix-turn-helix transcriptional regulator [Clostridiaceae bacterium]|nr:helix-turn-helix transcriptional regulator [Clostridiaceae bacterium]
MNGVKYHRLMKRLSRAKLAEITHISIPTLIKMERVSHPGAIYAENYRKVSDALKVNIDDLIRNNYPDEDKGTPKRADYASRTENPSNYISVYRREHYLTFDCLALRLGLTSRERARQICSEESPSEKHIRTLATNEMISVEQFKVKYSFEGDQMV